MSNKAIGLFDSGVGGLTVMREVAELMPHEHLIYFGDTARLPYGTKSPAAVIRFAEENANFLLKQNIKLLIVACHTACTHSYETLKKTLPIPVIGVTTPGFEDLIASTKTKSVAVLGTASTIASGLFQSLLQNYEVHAIACPLFVPLVEDGLHSHPATALIVEHYLKPLLNTRVDAVLLACTHYPLLAPLIQNFLGPKVQLIHPAKSSALAAFNLLKTRHLLNSSPTPTYRFYASDDPEKFCRLAKIFFPRSIEKVELA